jgi:GAF domain-containing protein
MASGSREEALVTRVEELTRRLDERDREIAELRDRLAGELGALARVMEITASLNSTLKLDDLLDLVLRSSTELLQGEAASLLLVDEKTGDLVFEVSTGAGNERLSGTTVPAGQGIAGWVVEHGEPAIVDRPGEDARFYRGVDESSGVDTRNLLAVPLTVKGRTIGVVEVINKRGGRRFDESDLALAVALTNQAAIAIDNARLHAQLAEAVVTARMSYRL